jgi:hypothetical protein
MGEQQRGRGRGAQKPEEAPQAPQDDVAVAARVAELEAQLAEAQSALGAARALAGQENAPEGAGAAMIAALEALAAKVAEISVAQPQADSGSRTQTYGRDESAADVERSLRGTVSVGEHSGERTERPITFRSRGRNFNMVRKARHRYVDQGGETVVTAGVHYDFAPAGEFTTDDADVVDYIRQSPGFNVEVWEVGNEPDRVPSAEPELDRIMDARLALDVDTLDEIEHRERETWKRPIVLETIESARRSLRRAEADLEGLS